MKLYYKLAQSFLVKNLLACETISQHTANGTWPWDMVHSRQRLGHRSIMDVYYLCDGFKERLESFLEQKKHTPVKRVLRSTRLTKKHEILIFPHTTSRPLSPFLGTRNLDTNSYSGLVRLCWHGFTISSCTPCFS